MSDRIEYVVSACLAGKSCKYNGGSSPCLQVMELVRLGKARVICPECLGGLKIPRPPCECLGERVISKDGEDVTEKFRLGAERALIAAQKTGAKKAILKSRSPSCGYRQIYDGTFSRRLVPGNGHWAEKLEQAGFTIFTEEDFPIKSDRNSAG